MKPAYRDVSRDSLLEAINSMFSRLLFCSLSLAATCAFAAAADAPAVSAAEMAETLSAKQMDGASYIRLKMDVKQPSGGVKSALQIQIKSRASRAWDGPGLSGPLAQRAQRRGRAPAPQRKPVRLRRHLHPSRLRSHSRQLENG